MEYGKFAKEPTEEWLIQEGMRLESLRGELNKASQIMHKEALAFQEEKEKFKKQQQDFKAEMEEWERHVSGEKKRMEEEQSFFDKKFKVLELGFARLDADRKTFEAQKRAFAFKQKYESQDKIFAEDEENDVAEAASGMYFFRGVTHQLALKKRYKDLIKIYHPDNLDGDKSALQQINKEYEQLKKVLGYQRKA